MNTVETNEERKRKKNKRKNGTQQSIPNINTKSKRTIATKINNSSKWKLKYTAV